MKSLASKLNKRISIIGQKDIMDDYGQPLKSDTLITEIWASIEPLNGRELYAAMQVHAEVTTRIVIRFRTGIDHSMKVSYRGKKFQILYVINPDYADKELHIMCKELS